MSVLFTFFVYRNKIIKLFSYTFDRKCAIIWRIVFFVQTNVLTEKTKLNKGRVIECYLLLNQ